MKDFFGNPQTEDPPRYAEKRMAELRRHDMLDQINKLASRIYGEETGTFPDEMGGWDLGETVDYLKSVLEKGELT
jgi:hypothetical protein